MAIFYKNQGFSLTTTNATTVLSINTSSVAIVKDIAVTNTGSNAATLDMYVYDYSASTTYQFIHASVAGSCNGNAAQTVLNLEEGDAILAQTATVNVIKGVISYALLDRTGENG
jgi:hypothetical protein